MSRTRLLQTDSMQLKFSSHQPSGQKQIRVGRQGLPFLSRSSSAFGPEEGIPENLEMTSDTEACRITVAPNS